MADRQSLHNLIDELSEAQLDAARRILEELRVEAVAVDDDVLSPAELAEIEEARAEIRRGDWATLDQVKIENGLRNTAYAFHATPEATSGALTKT